MKKDYKKLMVIGSGPIVMSSYYPEVTEGSSDTSFITDSFEAMMKEAVQ